MVKVTQLTTLLGVALIWSHEILRCVGAPILRVKLNVMCVSKLRMRDAGKNFNHGHGGGTVLNLNHSSTLSGVNRGLVMGNDFVKRCLLKSN